ncbi:HAD domain-containing protein [Kitasatospora sp. NPDC096147]|uniref:HAD domain-containing protein n=1 Tax=Kitasatospora sp. NPDC096147 TaxID=3364093 RepID=UPI0038259C2B
MIGPTQHPLLFLDVDGPLIPFGAAPEEYPRYTTAPATNPLLGRVNPGHGPRLAELPCELVWATTWLEDANDDISPILGLPRLPVVRWPEPSEVDERDERLGLHWKTRTLVQWAAGRPFAWVDDELTDTDREWVDAQHPGPTLLHCVDSRRGLTGDDYLTLDAWLRQWVGAEARRSPTRP